MSKYKQFTIVMPGNRFGDYLSETMDGYYTKWEVRYLVKGKYEYHLKNVKVKGISLSEEDIDMKLINRTFDWYAEVHQAEKGGYPTWIKDLREKIYGKYKLSRGSN